MVEMNNDNSISLNKYISSRGICSRREADQWIEDQRLKINGTIAKKGNRVFEGDVVTLDGKALIDAPRSLYIALNKPVGIVCTTDLKDPKNIIDFVNHQERLFPIGRLDKPSQGLILLTNDGDIVNKILRAGNQHEKEYIVHVTRDITDQFLSKMRNGIPILDTITKKCKVEKINTRCFKITLTQGLNRQIRRMCEFLDYKISNLKRVRVMNITLEGLKPGEWRELTEKEIQMIQKMLQSSSKTEEASKDRNKRKG